ncbi:MAG: MFS transporter [Bythopirellula sp.]
MNTTILRLSVMMFLQFFLWGSWFATLGQCLGENDLADIIGASYGAAPLAAIISPLFLGLIADRFFPSQMVMGVLLLIGGGLMLMVPGFAAEGNTDALWWLFTGHLLCYMPTLGLGNSISFANIDDQNEFPKIRVWGTIGWIAAGLFVGFNGWSADFKIFQLAAGCSILLGFYSFFLPHTPPPAKGKPVNARTLFMLDAFAMMASIPFMIFIICSTLICIPLAYYYGFTSNLLGQVGFDQPASTMTLGQMSEIFFMLLIPYFFRRLGVKWMIIVGMAAWACRYLLFAYGAPDQVTWMILLAVLLHGICYDFFFVTGFMYTDQRASEDIRGQAQSMLVFFTQGIGMYFGYMIAGKRFGNTVTEYDALNESIASLKSPESVSFGESLGRMFSRSLPEGIDPQLLGDTMQQWKEFWTLPAIMAAVILVVFALLFHDKTDQQSSDQSSADESAN